MSLPSYPVYKDSGVQWLGVIPGHWTVRAIKSIAQGPGTLFIDGDWIESRHIADCGIRYITTGNVGAGSYKEQGSGFISEETFDLLNCTEVSPGDVLISRLNAPIGRACIVPDLQVRIVTSVDNVIVRPATGFERRFLVFRLSSPDYFHEAGNLASGATMQRISRSELGNIRLAFPPLHEQTAIAAFLDHETGKINALIAEQEKLLTLLAEKRQATISHAVTRGLNSRAPMKDSGVAWLGAVPAHWRVSPLKYLVSLKSGGTPSKENLDFWDGDVPWASAKDLKTEQLADTIDHITSLAIESGNAAVVPAGTVLVVVRGMILARTFPVVETLVPMAINQDLKGVVPLDGLLGRFLAWLLRGSAYESLLRLDEAGHGTKALRMDAWTSMRLPVPPIDEQAAIVGFLDTETARLDALTAEAERAIELLKERRSALIAAAVTGKIDVRDAVPRELAA